MRIGFASPFAYRPHVAQMAFLMRQCERLGYRTFVLGCDGALENCNSRVSKRGIAQQLECYKCRAGGIHSFLRLKHAPLDAPAALDEELLDLGRRFAFSTVATALQVEHPRETQAEDFKTLQNALSRGAATAYVNARRWIREQSLDCVLIFNGRFDLTRAVLEACVAENVRFVSFERSWFGAGMQLLPNENCLGLQNFHAMSHRWTGRPLSHEQAAVASRIITRRLARDSTGEWRQYNVGNSARYSGGRIRFLFLPSSQHEWLGDVDRTSGWQHPVEGLEHLFRRMSVPMSELVVRGHPGWAVKIAHYGPNRAGAFYREWAQRVGARYIESSESLDSHELMKLADVILLNGSSASMEAGWLGKPVVSFVPAPFTVSGISMNLFSPGAVDVLTDEQLALLTDPVPDPQRRAAQCSAALRYIYCANYRVFQFIEALRSTSAYSFEAAEPPDLSNLESLVRQGVLLEDDPHHAPDDREESAVVSTILAGRLEAIPAERPLRTAVLRAPLKRRVPYRLIDLVTR